MSSPKELLDAKQLGAKLQDLADSLASFIDGQDDVVLVGVRTRGAVLAQRLRKLFVVHYEWDLPVGVLDITLYRDDLSQLASQPMVRKTDLPFDVTDKRVILVDDVLFTGRTGRSALDEIVDFGRPKVIKFAVLVDRGCREYPIQPDFVSLRVETTPQQSVHVRLVEVDGEDRVLLTDLGGQ